MEKNKDIKEVLREELEREMLRVKKGRRVRALVVRPGCLPEERWVNTDGDTLRGIVGGPIEHAPLDGKYLVLVCCEVGKVLGYPPNRALFHEGAERPYDIIAGTFLVMKEDLWLEDYVDLTDGEVDEYKKIFEDPVCRWGYRL